MKKVAILTITNSGLNFGNRLQNYALQQALVEQGLEVETIISAKSVGRNLLLSKGRRVLKNLSRNDLRSKFFKQFNKKYIKFSDTIRYENVNEEVFNDKYDAFFAGSDQVWNPNFHFNSDFEFASFAPKNKRYSYAASIGVSEIKEEQIEAFVKNINGMNSISVREADSIELIKTLTGHDAFLHVDPTMLLDKSVYEEMECIPPQGLPPKYLLTYFLGSVTEEYKKNIQKLSEALGTEIIELSEWKGSKYYDIGPQHFLYVINHAEYICTDSFHGSVFSILFHKNFSMMQRVGNDVSMDSRIFTLAEKFGIEERIDNTLDLSITKKPINYVEVDKIIEEERKKAKNYFDEICKRR